MIRRAGVIVSTMLTAGLLSAAFALPAMATPKPDDPIISGDDRVIRTGGPNANSCDDAGLAGKIILTNKETPTEQTVSIVPSDIPAGYEVTGIVVKGGPGFNVYPPNVLNDLRAPQNKGGQQPTLSHWFVCGKKKTDTPPGNQPPGNQPPGNQPPANNPPANNPAPAPQGGTAADTGSELAATGAATTVPLVLGAALLLLGSGLVLAMRRRQHS